jgi:hypothetical protein
MWADMLTMKLMIGLAEARQLHDHDARPLGLIARKRVYLSTARFRSM